ALCSAIDYAHTRGMVHRDLKPANVMINEEGQVVLTDFGITRMLGATQFTQTGAMPGTPAYMSPEQAQGQHGDARSDIYSLGVMLYELTTGVVPFDADTPFAVILKHISAPLPLPTKIAPHLPPAVEAVIVKAMSKQPAERYQRAGDLAAALRQAVGLGADELYHPLPVIAPRPQIQELDPAAKQFTDQVKPISRPTPPVEATLPPPPPAPTLPPAAPPRLFAIMPLLLGGGLLVVLLLGGLVGWLLLSNRNNPATASPPLPVTPTGTVLAQLGATTPMGDPNATGTAQAQATTVAAPTLTAQALEAGATATVVQQTAEAQIIAGFLSAQAGTATAQAAQTVAAEATATARRPGHCRRG
ncbi:MAG: serine/threonine-protein kinase, partial [Anaerolineae bacterium]